jgi:hypothetical protein
VLVVERLDDGRADLPGSDDDDLHRRKRRLAPGADGRQTRE